jgi:hypothetical protein
MIAEDRHLEKLNNMESNEPTRCVTPEQLVAGWAIIVASVEKRVEMRTVLCSGLCPVESGVFCAFSKRVVSCLALSCQFPTPLLGVNKNIVRIAQFLLARQPHFAEPKLVAGLDLVHGVHHVLIERQTAPGSARLELYLSRRP